VHSLPGVVQTARASELPFDGAWNQLHVVGDESVGGPPMREDSLHRFASIGKPITAAAALALVADGVVALTDPVDDLLPELAAPRVVRTLTSPLDDTVAADRPITVEDLLRSTNGHGFPSDFSAPAAVALMERLLQGPPQPQRAAPPDEWMATLGEIPLLHQPGEGFTYNAAFDILGVLIARASGRSFPEYLTARILRPLGMDETGFAFPSGTDDRRTSYYGQRDGGGIELLDGPDGQWASEPRFPSGAGGLVSTASDLVAFARMLLAGGGEVLPTALVTAMRTDHLTPAIRATDSVFLDGQSWGYGGGVDIDGRQPWNVPGRYGWIGGTGTSSYIVPSDGSIAILLTQVQLGGPGGAPVLDTFARAAAAQLGHDR
jgi:CubicO group peptidase (beta-lactamase class C family)